MTENDEPLSAEYMDGSEVPMQVYLAKDGSDVTTVTKFGADGLSALPPGLGDADIWTADKEIIDLSNIQVDPDLVTMTCRVPNLEYWNALLGDSVEILKDVDGAESVLADPDVSEKEKTLATTEGRNHLKWSEGLSRLAIKLNQSETAAVDKWTSETLAGKAARLSSNEGTDITQARLLHGIVESGKQMSDLFLHMLHTRLRLAAGQNSHMEDLGIDRAIQGLIACEDGIDQRRALLSSSAVSKDASELLASLSELELQDEGDEDLLPIEHNLGPTMTTWSFTFDKAKGQPTLHAYPKRELAEKTRTGMKESFLSTTPINGNSSNNIDKASNDDLLTATHNFVEKLKGAATKANNAMDREITNLAKGERLDLARRSRMMDFTRRFSTYADCLKSLEEEMTKVWKDRLESFNENSTTARALKKEITDMLPSEYTKKAGKILDLWEINADPGCHSKTFAAESAWAHSELSGAPPKTDDFEGESLSQGSASANDLENAWKTARTKYDTYKKKRLGTRKEAQDSLKGTNLQTTVTGFDAVESVVKELFSQAEISRKQGSVADPKDSNWSSVNAGGDSLGQFQEVKSRKKR